MNDFIPLVLILKEGRYLARIPDVPGCVTGGANILEAVSMARDALAACILVYEDKGIKLPERKTLRQIKDTFPDSLIFMLDVDTIEHRNLI